jgi:hypothetical protein
MALWPTQPPIQWVPGALSLEVKLPGHEVDHSPPSSAAVKEWVELYLHSPILLHGLVLIKKSTGTTLPFTFTPTPQMIHKHAIHITLRWSTFQCLWVIIYFSDSAYSTKPASCVLIHVSWTGNWRTSEMCLAPRVSVWTCTFVFCCSKYEPYLNNGYLISLYLTKM